MSDRKQGRRCACASDDAAACLNLRHKGHYVVGCGAREVASEREEECPCACHDGAGLDDLDDP